MRGKLTERDRGVDEAAELALMKFSAPSFPSVVEAEKWWHDNREKLNERIRIAGDLVEKAHALYLLGRREEASDAYEVAADACEELGWEKGLGDECRKSAWWCRQPSSVPRPVDDPSQVRGDA